MVLWLLLLLLLLWVVFAARRWTGEVLVDLLGEGAPCMSPERKRGGIRGGGEGL